MKRIIFSLICYMVPLGAMELDDVIPAKETAERLIFSDLNTDVKKECLWRSVAHSQLPQTLYNLQILKRVCKEWNTLCRNKIDVIKAALAQVADLEGMNQLAFDQLKICCGNLLAGLPDLSPEERIIFMVIMKNKHLSLARKVGLLTPLILHYGLEDFELMAALFFTEPSHAGFDAFFQVPRRTAFEKKLAESITKYTKCRTDNAATEKVLPPDHKTLLDFLKEEELRPDELDFMALMHRYFADDDQGKEWVLKNRLKLTEDARSILEAIETNNIQKLLAYVKNGDYVAWEVLWAVVVFGTVAQLEECYSFIKLQTGIHNFRGFEGVRDGHLNDIDCVYIAWLRRRSLAAHFDHALWDFRHAMSDQMLQNPHSFNMLVQGYEVAHSNDVWRLVLDGMLLLDTQEEMADCRAMYYSHLSWYQRLWKPKEYNRQWNREKSREKVGLLHTSESSLLYLAARVGSLEFFEKYLPQGKRKSAIRPIGFMLYLAHANGHRDIVKYLADIQFQAPEVKK